MFSVIDESRVSEHLERGAVLLTASSQLALDWKRRLMSDACDAVCETPAVMGWNTWLGTLAAGLDALPVALNRVQERWLWEQVIRADLSASAHSSACPSAQSAASVRGLAGHASQAYALIQEYRIDMGELAFGGEEADALVGWIDAVRKCLGEGTLAGRMLAADVGQQVLTCVNEIYVDGDETEKSTSILLAGFDVLTPMQEALLVALQTSGVQLLQIKPEMKSATSKASVCQLYACKDVQAECDHIAVQVKKILADNSQARIAIVNQWGQTLIPLPVKINTVKLACYMMILVSFQV